VKLLSILFTLLLAACSTTTEGPVLQRYYNVESGDTWQNLSEKFNVDKFELARANQSSLNRDPVVGEQIYIPYNIAALRGYNERKHVQQNAAHTPVMFAWPVRQPVLSAFFGWRGRRMHEGLDLRADVGTEVVATAGGKVLYVGRRLRSYGLIVVIDHGEGWSSVYAHLSRSLVKENDMIHQGQFIALSGRSGRVSGPHLHFEIRKGADPLDPLLHLPKN